MSFFRLVLLGCPPVAQLLIVAWVTPQCLRNLLLSYGPVFFLESVEQSIEDVIGHEENHEEKIGRLMCEIQKIVKKPRFLNDPRGIIC